MIMGNQKFKLSDMIPNAWFFKLKDMSTKPPNNYKSNSLNKPKKHRLPPPPPPPSSPPSSAANDPVEQAQCQPRKSYHIARDLTLQSPQSQDPPLSPPRKSKSRKSSARRTAGNHHRQFSLSSSVSTTCTCPATTSTTTTTTTTTATDEFLSPAPAPAHHGPPKKPERFDIVIDVSKPYSVNGFDIELPRIVTKPAESTKPTKVSPSLKEQQQRTSHSPPSRRFSVTSPAGVRLKINSPKILARKQGQNGNHPGRRSVSSSSSSSSLSWRKRRSISESFAVVKSSRDPQKDFRESMVEMIVQNNLRASKDLEDLLACYLSLNSDEYHDVIINVFKQIWFDLIHLRHQKLVS